MFCIVSIRTQYNLKMIIASLISVFFFISFPVTAQYFPCAKRVNNCKSRATYTVQCDMPFDTESGTVECVFEATDQISCVITDFASLASASFTEFPTTKALYETFAEQCFKVIECSERFQCRKVKADVPVDS